MKESESAVQLTLVYFIRLLHDTGLKHLEAPTLDLGGGDIREDLVVTPTFAKIGTRGHDDFVSFTYPTDKWNRIYNCGSFNGPTKKEAEALLEELRDLMPEHDPELVRIATAIVFSFGED